MDWYLIMNLFVRQIKIEDDSEDDLEDDVDVKEHSLFASDIEGPPTSSVSFLACHPWLLFYPLTSECHAL